MRACPRSDRCLAFDSSSRRFSLHERRPAHRGRADAHREPRVPSCPSIAGSYLSDDALMTAAIAIIGRSSAGGHQLPADQSHSRAGWPRSSSAGSARSSSRWCATCRSRVWRLFADLDLERGREAARFASLHDCFIRELKDGARPIDPDPGVLVSPCDAIVGACGARRGRPAASGQGLPLHAARTCSAIRRWSSAYRDGRYVTLRLTVEHVPPLPRAPRLPRSSRSPTSPATPGTSIRSRSSASRSCSARTSGRYLQTRLAGTGQLVTLVPVAAILVASIRLHFLDVLLHLQLPRPERDPLRRAVPQGRGDGLVRARLDHHRRSRRPSCGSPTTSPRTRHPDGPAAVPPALSHSSFTLRLSPVTLPRAAGARAPAAARRGAARVARPCAAESATASAAAPAPGGRGTPRGPPAGSGRSMLARACSREQPQRAQAGVQQIVADRAVDAFLRPGRPARAPEPTPPAARTPSPRAARCRRSRCATGTRSSRRWRSGPPDRRRSDSPRQTTSGKRRCEPLARRAVADHDLACPAAAAPGSPPGSSRPRRGRRRARSAAAAGRRRRAGAAGGTRVASTPRGQCTRRWPTPPVLAARAAATSS